MILTWMLYGVLSAALVTAGALAADALARTVGYARRWVWAAALGLMLLLVGLAPMRGGESIGSPVVGRATIATTTAVPLDAPTWLVRARRSIDNARDELAELPALLPKALGARYTTMTGRALLVAWAAISTMLIVSLIGGRRRIGRAIQRWPRTEIDGVAVRLSPDVGPVVVGLARPEVVLPHWLLVRSLEEQRLVVAHEVEHLRARDTWLLTGGYVLATLLPWCLPVWYLFSRLRLAVEIDCDRRVLARGTAPQRYGSLLIDVAEQCSATPAGVAALSVHASHLQRRLVAMHQRTQKYVAIRAAVAAGLCALALAAACEARMPTSADIDQLDARQVKAQAQQLGLIGKTDSVLWRVDGKAVSQTEAMAIAPKERIAAVDIVTANGTKTISIRTRDNAALTQCAAASACPRETNVYTGDSVAWLQQTSKVAAGGRGRRVGGPGDLSAKLNATAKSNPIIFIDKVRSTNDQMKALDPKAIESVEILKGSAAAAAYGDEALGGVIVITMKKL